MRGSRPGGLCLPPSQSRSAVASSTDVLPFPPLVFSFFVLQSTDGLSRIKLHCQSRLRRLGLALLSLQSSRTAGEQPS